MGHSLTYKVPEHRKVQHLTYCSLCLYRSRCNSVRLEHEIIHCNERINKPGYYIDKINLL
jgi:hypothetical protein